MVRCHTDSGGAANVVAHLDENQAAGAARFFFHVDDGRGAAEHVTNQQRLMKLKITARPHAARQRHRRHETAAFGMAVGPDIGLRGQR
jgi:hypothetical protein